MRWFVFLFVIGGGACFAFVGNRPTQVKESSRGTSKPYFTVDDRLDQFGYVHRPLWEQTVKDPYPAKNLRLIVFKDERKLEVWQFSSAGWHRLKKYQITAASGTAGPKQQQGDRQVPEGFYRISDLNPNSSYHLSMRVNYPNEFDRNMAQQEQRSDLGGDIFIHGNSVSIGCVAIGDHAIEELFVLVADARNAGGEVEVLMLPGKPAQRAWFIRNATKPWIQQLYFDLYQTLATMGWSDS